MNSYNYLTQWIGWIIPLISVGATARVVYIAFQKTTDPENAERYNRKIIITIKAAVVLISVPAFIKAIEIFY